ncbi:MAG: SDR family NAD(P)-dependent oxidoreductase [Planctomycetota bacterium]|nr:SDR family NAD(P)-dependent oxidoreductase [Planctomycetota bacterium]MEC8513291.1 SDR family NAD(P)-dependent oxidoreductase [Planctomycetota bacterium]
MSSPTGSRGSGSADRPLALVTGATGGIGGSIARRLAARGARVICTGRDAVRAEAIAAQLAEESGAECFGHALDVTDPASLDSLERAVEGLGGLDWLVNNAGVAETAPLLSAESPALLHRLMDVNFRGPLELFERFGPGMFARGYGRVVQIASSAALGGYPYVSAYSASKHALLGWSRSAALECAPKGVAISTVCPHYVDTPLTDRSIETMREKTGRSEEDLRAFVASQNPSGVIVRPEQVAEVTADLLGSDRSGVVIELTGDAPVTLEEGVACASSEVS